RRLALRRARRRADRGQLALPVHLDLAAGLAAGAADDEGRVRQHAARHPEAAAGGVRMSWRPLLDALGCEPDFITELRERYGEPHRRYHGVAHIDALADVFEQVAAGPGWRQPAEVALAILFHDAIYQPGRADNEARSAELARERLADWDHVDVERVVALIEATAAHGAANTDGDPDLGHFLDTDTAILGAPPAVYDRYARGVLEEY